MIRPRAEQLLWIAGLCIVPALAWGQAERAPAAAHPAWHALEDMAGGTTLFVMAIAILAVVYRLLRERSRRLLLTQFIERGQEIPAALLPTGPSRLRELRRGVWLTALGVGVGLALYVASDSFRVAAWCLIPLLLGMASLINAALFYPDCESRR